MPKGNSDEVADVINGMARVIEDAPRMLACCGCLCFAAGAALALAVIGCYCLLR